MSSLLFPKTRKHLEEIQEIKRALAKAIEKLSINPNPLAAVISDIAASEAQAKAGALTKEGMVHLESQSHEIARILILNAKNQKNQNILSDSLESETDSLKRDKEDLSRKRDDLRRRSELLKIKKAKEKLKS